jgi:hypothetical protein
LAAVVVRPVAVIFSFSNTAKSTCPAILPTKHRLSDNGPLPLSETLLLNTNAQDRTPGPELPETQLHYPLRELYGLEILAVGQCVHASSVQRCSLCEGQRGREHRGPSYGGTALGSGGSDLLCFKQPASPRRSGAAFGQAHRLRTLFKARVRRGVLLRLALQERAPGFVPSAAEAATRSILL